MGRHEAIRTSLDRMQNRVIVSDRITGAFTKWRHSERPSLTNLGLRTELVPKKAPDEGAGAFRRVEMKNALVGVWRRGERVGFR